MLTLHANVLYESTPHAPVIRGEIERETIHVRENVNTRNELDHSLLIDCQIELLARPHARHAENEKRMK